MRKAQGKWAERVLCRVMTTGCLLNIYVVNHFLFQVISSSMVYEPKAKVAWSVQGAKEWRMPRGGPQVELFLSLQSKAYYFKMLRDYNRHHGFFCKNTGPEIRDFCKPYVLNCQSKTSPMETYLFFYYCQGIWPWRNIRAIYDITKGLWSWW